MTSLYISIAFHTRKTQGTESVFFLPNHNTNLSSLLPAEEAYTLCESLLKKYKLSEESVTHAMSKFDKALKTDLALRLVHNGHTRADETDKKRYMSFDSLAEFILGQYVTKCKHELSVFAATLRMSGLSKFDSRKCYENLLYAVSPL